MALSKVVIIGAGGHARVVERLVQLTAGLELVGFADAKPDSIGERIGKSSVIACYEDLPRWREAGISKVALALGNNYDREKMAIFAESHGLQCVSLVHPSVIIDESVVFGNGSVICAGAILGVEVTIGTGVIINSGVIIDHESKIGNYAQVSPGCRIAGRVSVRHHAFIGIGACLLPRVSIGANAIVGAGAVVTKDVEDGQTVVGIPAKLLS